HDALPIYYGVISAQRQLEAVFAFGRAVTGAGGAADLVEHRLNVADEADLRRIAKIADVNFQSRLLTAGTHGHGSITRAHGIEQTIRTDFDDGLGGLEMCVGGQVDIFAIGRL